MIEGIVNRLRAFILFRLVVVTLLLGSFYILKIGYERIYHQTAFSYLIASLYFLTIIYAIILRRLKNKTHLTIFTYIQIIIDISAETLIIFLTGGIASWFSFLYPLSIVSSSILLNRGACYIIATISSILYGLMVDFQFYQIIPRTTDITFTAKEYFYNTFANIMAFYLIAFLSGHLSERLYKTAKSLEERETVLSDLRVLSRDIVESMPGGVLTTDLNKRIITFNSSAQRITGYRLEEVLGKTPEEIFPFLKNIRFHKRTEGEITRNGKTIIIGIGFSKLKNSAGEEIGMIGTFQDLTELKEMELEIKKKEKWALIGELSASVAHELRNPLASLKASIEMLLDNNMPRHHASRLATIAISEMERLNSIITDFLIYARPPRLDMNPFDLHGMLRDVVMLLQGAGGEDKSVKITSRLKGQLTIMGDSRQLKQVFWNLGINAIEAVPDGGEIEIYTNEKNGAVEVVFSDNGIGLKRDNMEKIFYPFFTTKERGTGLGLSIAQRIIEEHGGKITATSEGEGKGATFKVTLPKKPARA